MMNKFGPCAVMAQVTRMAKEDVIRWETIDGEYANDGVRLWRDGNPSEHFDIFPDYEECEDAEDDDVAFFFVTYFNVKSDGELGARFEILTAEQFIRQCPTFGCEDTIAKLYSYMESSK